LWAIGGRVKHLVPKAGAVLAGLGIAAATAFRARATERQNPPQGKFMVVDGVRMHVVERGSGDPIVLLHGNGVSAADWLTCGILDDLATTHRVIAFDRPGFGYSARPRNRRWTPDEQARIIHAALVQLGVADATVVGHSWGTLVALALASRYPSDVRGLVLASGYYFPTPRIDVPLSSGPAIPLLGDILRYTVSPIVARLIAPLVVKQLFAPSPVAPSFEQYPLAMSLRPSALRAAASDTAMMIGAAFRLQSRYRDITVPENVIAGSDDLVVNPTVHSVRLADVLPNASLSIIEGAGHMIQHTAPEQLVAAVRANTAAAARVNVLPQATTA
jgi:pimeloyl-ACP methyl ester carboxylesterase